MNHHQFVRQIGIFVFLWGLVHFSPELFGQDRPSLLVKVKKDRQQPKQLFIGKQVSVRTVVTRIDKPDIERGGVFNQIAENVWRFDRSSDGSASVQNGEFVFEALPENQGKSYRYGVLGFDVKSHKLVDGSTTLGFALIWNPTSVVMDWDIVDFLSVPTLTIKSIEPVVSKCGRPAQRVEWSCTAFEKIRDCEGELVWLNEDGYLIEKSEYRSTFPGGPGKPEFLQILRTHTEFSTENGWLYPISTTKIDSNNVSFKTDVISIQEANQDKKFYTAEWFGLVSPPNPKRWRTTWFVLGVIFVVGSFFLARTIRVRSVA